MRKEPKKELKYLIELQNDLIKDFETEKSTASPLYYGLLEPYKEPVPDGCGDETVFYDRDAAIEETLEEVWNSMSIKEKKEAADDFIHSGIIKTDNQDFEIIDESDFINYICEKKDLERYEICMKERIVRNRLFLTQNAANAYLTKYGHDHPTGTVAYAMTAMHSPQYKQLLDILYNIDWEHSQIQFRIPDHFWPEEKLKDKLYCYLCDNLNVTVMQLIAIYNGLYEFLKNTIEWQEKIVNGKSQIFYNPNRLTAQIAYYLNNKKNITIKTPFSINK